MSERGQTRNPPPDNADTVEACESCDADTPHAVSIELRTESEHYGGNQPYRVTECLNCGGVSETRIGV